MDERQLLRALNQNGCPVCDHLRDHETDFRFWFNAERYHQREMLDALTNSLGFCVGHGKFLAESSQSNSPMTAAHEIVSRRVRSQFEASGFNQTTWTSLDPCPACDSFNRTANRTVSFLAHALETTADDYGDPGIACFPHFRSLATTASPALFRDVLEIQEQQMQAVRETVQSMTETTTTTEDGTLPPALETALHVTVGHDIESSALPPPNVDPHASPDPVGDFSALLDAGRGCPICLEIGRAWQAWLAWLLNVDYKSDQMQDVLPTCPEHVWECARYGDTALAIAIVDAASGPVIDRLTRARQNLPDTTSESRNDLFASIPFSDIPLRFVRQLNGDQTRKARAALQRPIRCPVCDRLETAQDRAVELLLVLLEQPRHQHAFEDGYGLCLHHCSYVLAQNPSPEIAQLIQTVETAKVARLQWELREAQRKQAWDVRPEQKGSEQSAWLRAIARFSGSYTPLSTEETQDGPL